MARLTSIDMGGHIDDVFQSGVGSRISKTGGGYIDGKWVEGTTTTTPHKINIQPLNQKDINFLQSGGERIQDTRKIYVNDGVNPSISEADTWTLVDVNGNAIDGEFKCYSLDNRPWRNYCRFYAVRIDQ
ncbi:hypothetical protein MYOV024v1_p0014 [Vibrio phage PS34B.2]|nr:hypothetical protein MYOV024v1_p0014 [Vibrio phage PS34B.2]